MRALKISLAHGSVLVCTFFVTLFTASFGWPTEVERRGSIVESVSVDFGLPVPFATASVTSGDAYHYAEDPGFLRTFNPWENPADYSRDRFLLSWLIFAVCGAAVVEGCRWLIRRGPRSQNQPP